MRKIKTKNTVIKSLFPKFVKTAECNPQTIAGYLHPEEEPLVAGAVEKRKKEFYAGRICAQALLKEFHVQDFPILIGAHRAPIWPDEICGSITHSKDYCAVALAQKGDITNLGLDAEHIGSVKEKTWSHILTEEELSCLSHLSKAEQQRSAATIFSAKECLFKCLHPITSVWLNFQDADITIKAGSNKFQATLLKDIPRHFPNKTCFEGNFLVKDAFVYTGIVH